MKSWTDMTNEELVMNLDLWLQIDGKVITDTQKDFFKEVSWRLLMETQC